MKKFIDSLGLIAKLPTLSRTVHTKADGGRSPSRLKRVLLTLLVSAAFVNMEAVYADDKTPDNSLFSYGYSDDGGYDSTDNDDDDHGNTPANLWPEGYYDNIPLSRVLYSAKMNDPRAYEKVILTNDVVINELKKLAKRSRGMLQTGPLLKDGSTSSLFPTDLALLHQINDTLLSYPGMRIATDAGDTELLAKMGRSTQGREIWGARLHFRSIRLLNKTGFTGRIRASDFRKCGVVIKCLCCESCRASSIFIC